MSTGANIPKRIFAGYPESTWCFIKNKVKSKYIYFKTEDRLRSAVFMHPPQTEIQIKHLDITSDA